MNDEFEFPPGCREPSISDKELFDTFSSGQRLHHYEHQNIVRISKSLVINGGPVVIVFVSESAQLPAAKIHRTFTVTRPDSFGFFVFVWFFLCFVLFFWSVCCCLLCFFLLWCF